MHFIHKDVFVDDSLACLRLTDPVCGAAALQEVLLDV